MWRSIDRALEHKFCDPMRVLADSHRAIEYFLEVLLVVSRDIGRREVTSLDRRAFEVALDYFRDTAPLHTRDEEGSLFPRLREKYSSENESVLELLEELHDEHKLAGRCHKQVDGLGRRWLAGGNLCFEEERLLKDLVAGLASTYIEHIAIEERAIFPLAARLLPASELEAMSQEMASRRRLMPVVIVP